MSALLTTLLIAMFLPYLAKVPLIKAMNDRGGYDNRHPRQQQAALEGFGARANAAHYNSFEALIIYAIAVFIVISVGNVDTLAIALGWTFIVARIGYMVCYWFDKASLRSLIWLVSMIACFWLALRAVLSL
ncbi:MAG: MAPEG family protein [Gammaproteobacteria bacterium]|nr:MAPEG family protein [Gammaproteobacteria bacterium]